MKKELMDFILKVLDKSFKFLSKLRCSFCCCNSNCVVDKSVHVSKSEDEERDLRELRKNKSESSLDSLKTK